MPRIECVSGGLYGTNCYLVRAEQEGSCVVIDPGCGARPVAERLQAAGMQLAAIFLTHGHFDHVTGVKELREMYRCPAYLHAAELSLPQALTAGPLEPTDFWDDGTEVEAAGLRFRVLHTPGHTPGSVCLLTQDALFSGDTLFAGFCGRTDLAGGDPAQMAASLARLRALPYDGAVYPGHERATRLDTERACNPYLRGILE